MEARGGFEESFLLPITAANLRLSSPPCYEMWPFPRVYILGKSTNALHLVAHRFFLFIFFFILIK